MKISFRPFYFNSKVDCDLQAKWENDPEIRHLFSYFPNKESSQKQVTSHSVSQRGLDRKFPSQRIMVLLDDEPVGEASYEMNPPHLVTHLPDTAWMAIVIGEAQARNKGFGREILTYVEQLAIKAGAKRAELGVFEFNERAIRFYTKLGYHELARIPSFTYWKGRMWDDIRMLKTLEATSL